jgi:hypothetical protein
MKEGKKTNVEYRFEAMDAHFDGSVVGCVCLSFTSFHVYEGAGSKPTSSYMNIKSPD